MDSHKKSLFETKLPQPNPIINKDKQIDEKLKWKFIRTEKKQFWEGNGEADLVSIDEDETEIHFQQYIDDNRSNIIYQKFNNTLINTIPYNFQKYSASHFFDIKKLKTSLNTQQDLISLFPTGKDKQTSILNKGLKFNSLFESGNLFLAIKVRESEYNLIMQNDTNSKGNTQWFYFSVENTTKNQAIRFNIINFLKNDSLFNYGQKPACFSVMKHKKSKTNWQKCGKQIIYFRNRYIRENTTNKYYYTLSFVYKFEYSNDQVYFAQCYPYTYTQMLQLIKKNEFDPHKKKLFHHTELCKTIGKQSVPLMAIGNGRQKVLVMARQHPGESPGSYMMEGVIEFLLSSEAEFLRSNFTFFVIPMVNPDGVIHGNYRCNLNGQDLNRQWKQPHRINNDSVYYIKELARNNDFKMILDLHGHSKKYNAFFYGNPQSSRKLVIIASQINSGISLQDSSFTIGEGKKSTARVALQEETQGSCFTFETSFHGFKKQDDVLSFSIEGYKQLGKDLMIAFHKFNKGCCKQLISKEKEIEIDTMIKKIDEIVWNQEQSDGSESNPEQDQLEEREYESVIMKQQQLEQSQQQSQGNEYIQRKSLRIGQRSNRKRYKSDKYTQTESNQFDNIMLDPKILNLVEQQLNSLEEGQLKQLAISGQTYQRKKKEITTQYCYNFSSKQHQIVNLGPIETVDQECQTAICLQSLLEKIQIFSIRVNKYSLIQNKYFNKEINYYKGKQLRSL